MNFAPSVEIDGKTVTPKGYVWVLGFALRGCPWAVKEANKPEFKEMVRADLVEDAVKRLKSTIKRHELKILECRSEIDDFSTQQCNKWKT